MNLMELRFRDNRAHHQAEPVDEENVPENSEQKKTGGTTLQEHI